MIHAGALGCRHSLRATAAAFAVCATLVSPMTAPFASPAHAQSRPAKVAGCRRSFRRVCRRSRATLPHSGILDTRDHARGEPGGCSRHFAKGRDGADADHAVDMDGTPRPSRARRRSLRSARQYSGWRGVPPRTPRPLWIARIPGRLQCRSASLRRSSGDRPTASGRNAGLCRGDRSADRRGTG